MPGWRERAENLLLGGTLICWGIRGIVGLTQRPTVVHAALIVLNLTVGTLLAVRAPARRQENWWSWTLSIPCVVVGMVMFRLASEPSNWGILASSLFCVGTLLTLISLVSLGRSFAVFPSLRSVISHGPYRLIRHPAYLGESLMALACFLADPGWGIGLSLAGIPVFLVWRIQAEERELSHDAAYIRYSQRVRWRMLPGIW